MYKIVAVLAFAYCSGYHCYYFVYNNVGHTWESQKEVIYKFYPFGSFLTMPIGHSSPLHGAPETHVLFVATPLLQMGSTCVLFVATQLLQIGSTCVLFVATPLLQIGSTCVLFVTTPLLGRDYPWELVSAVCR